MYTSQFSFFTLTTSARKSKSADSDSLNFLTRVVPAGVSTRSNKLAPPLCTRSIPNYNLFNFFTLSLTARLIQKNLHKHSQI